MNHISIGTNRVMDNISSGINETVSNLSISQEAIELVNYLFKIFDVHVAAFNAFTKDNGKLNFMKQEWVICFQNSKLEKNELIKGTNKVRETGFTFMITPAEFIELCRPKKEIRPLSDTRPEWMTSKGIESDYHKANKKRVALDNLSNMKSFLKR